MDGWRARTLSFEGKITLIKHVLSWIPIQLKTWLPVPKACSIHNILANFFWSAMLMVIIDMLGWVGVLFANLFQKGVRDFNQVLHFLNEGWNFISGNSLWSSFMREKYGNPSSVAYQALPASVSHCWRCVHPHLAFRLENDKWLLGKTKIPLWPCENPRTGKSFVLRISWVQWGKADMAGTNGTESKDVRRGCEPPAIEGTP